MQKICEFSKVKNINSVYMVGKRMFLHFHKKVSLTKSFIFFTMMQIGVIFVNCSPDEPTTIDSYNITIGFVSETIMVKEHNNLTN